MREKKTQENGYVRMGTDLNGPDGRVGHDGQRLEKFTPVPWKLQDYSYMQNKSQLVITKTANGSTKTICRMKRPYGDIEEIVANAHLLLAAPDMYDFVKSFTTFAGQIILMNADNGKELYKKAVAICKKARGEE